MTRPSKRAQVEAMGWKLTAIPRHFGPGLIRDSRSGYVSPAYADYKHPEAWTVTPPPGRNLAPRRFEGASPNAAVRWAFEQAATPEPSAAAGGVAGLVQLMAAAGKSGVVAEGAVAHTHVPALPDAELLYLCREIAGCDRIADAGRSDDTCPWDQPVAFKVVQSRISEAVRDRERLIPRVIELEATTPAGVLAKLQVVVGLFDTARGQRAAAVQALAKDLVRVLGAGPAAAPGNEA